MRRSSNAIGPSCAAGRWPSAARRMRAAWWPPPATRRERSASGRPFPCPAPSASVRTSPSSGRTSRSTARSSQQVFAIFREVTPLVEGLSLDEAYLDVTENAWGEPLGVNVAKRIKARIRETTGLTASAGVAPNKFLAKIASAWRKPDGLTVIAPERVESFLQKLDGRCALGRGARHRGPPARARHQHAARRARGRSGGAPRRRRQHGRLAAQARRSAKTTVRSSPIGRPSRHRASAPTRTI